MQVAANPIKPAVRLTRIVGKTCSAAQRVVVSRKSFRVSPQMSSAERNAVPREWAAIPSMEAAIPEDNG
jgi:hypothetical protein